MHIRYGYSIDMECTAATPFITILDVHPTQRADLTEPDDMLANGLVDGMSVDVGDPYLDTFGNLCRRLIAPPGGIRLTSDGIIKVSGFPDDERQDALAIAPEELPAETLLYLLGSRYCETDKLMALAWDRFQTAGSGWDTVTSICGFVHDRLRFDYASARPTRSAAEAYDEQLGVCRDFAHLAITLCRCLNIPARYCTGYLGDIGVPPDGNRMDFSAWFEAYLDGQWWTFDARHNARRIGRIIIARGRDATDVPIIHSFGFQTMKRFEVVTDEVEGARFPVSSQARREHWDIKVAQQTFNQRR
jgi:transglutaminase-like putative cysteine protease